MKRLILFGLFLLAVIGVFGAVTASEEGKLLIWADDTRSPIMKELGAKFQAKYGIPVTVQEINFGDIRDQLGVAGPAGKGPDILIGPHDWLGKLVVNGLVAPLDLGKKKKDFLPVAVDAFTWAGTTYGMPYAIESIGLIYNKKLVPRPPKTWDELVKIGAKISDKSKKQWGFLLPQPDPYHSFPLMSAGGAYVFGKNADGTLNPFDIGLNNAGAVRGMQLLVDLIKEGIMPLGVDYNTMTTLFKEGKVGMILTGPWAFDDFLKAGVNFGFAPIPTIDGKKPRPFVGVQAFMVSSFSKNQLMAKAFLDEFVATKETMLALFERGRRPPVYLPAQKAIKDALTKGVLDSAAEGIPMPNIPEMDSVWAAWSNAIELILNGKLSPQAALDEAVAQIRTAIERSKKK